MKNRLAEIVDLRKKNDALLKKIEQQLDDINDKIVNVNTTLYGDSLRNLDEEQLHSEWCDRIGDELREFDWYMYHDGREKIEEILINQFEFVQWDRLEDHHDK